MGLYTPHSNLSKTVSVFYESCWRILATAVVVRHTCELFGWKYMNAFFVFSHETVIGQMKCGNSHCYFPILKRWVSDSFSWLEGMKPDVVFCSAFITHLPLRCGLRDAFLPTVVIMLGNSFGCRLAAQITLAILLWHLSSKKHFNLQNCWSVEYI